MNRPTRAFRARRFVLAGAVLLAGCSVLAPQPDRTRFYVLTATPPAAAAASDRLAIGLGPIAMPEYLDHLEVVTRAAPNRLELSPTDRWAESFDDNVRGVLARNLSGALPAAHIVDFPWYPTAHLDYEIAVVFERFERSGANATELAAQWTIRGGRDRRVLIARQSRFSESAADGTTEAAAGALSADLGDLSQQIAAAIAQLNRDHAARAGG